MNVKRNITLVMIYSSLIHVIFSLAVILPFFQNQLGLGFHELMMGEALFAAIIILMEVPSGWMSDVWSRRATLYIGSFFAACGFALLMVSQNLWMAMLSQAIVGIGVAFNSGTVTSLLYDSLAMEGREEEYQKLEGKRHGIGLYSIAGASIVGGILYQFNPYLPLLLDAFVMMIAMVVAIMMIEPDRIKKDSEHHPIKDMLVTMKYALHGHKEIAGIIIVSMVLFSSTKVFMWIQQPYMQTVGISTDYFGYIMAGGFVFGGLVGHFGSKIQFKIPNRHMIMRLVAIVLALCGFAIMFPVAPSIIFICAISAIWGFGFPYVQNAINKHADPSRRATILSTMGLLISVMFIPLSQGVGWLNDNYSTYYALSFIAAYLFILTSFGFWLWKRGAKKS